MIHIYSHKHSLEAYVKLIQSGVKKSRTQTIFEIFFTSGREYTDREILHIVKPDSDDMNYVRPRISELVLFKILEEHGVKREGDNNVRKCRLRNVEKTQINMGFE